MWVVGSVKKSKASSDGPRAFFKGFSLHMVYIVYISITDDLILSEHDDATWMNMGRLLPPPLLPVLFNPQPRRKLCFLVVASDGA